LDPAEEASWQSKRALNEGTPNEVMSAEQAEDWRQKEKRAGLRGLFSFVE